jgi:hypothetical protein
MSTAPIDLANMPLEELRLLTIQHEAQAPAVEEVKSEPAETPTEPETPAVPDKKRFRREIDLEDGSGKQVFEGATVDELVENLANAQKHATRKIREQAEKLKAAEKPLEPAKKLSLEERLDQMERRDQWNAAQLSFVAAHPDYVANAQNGQDISDYMEMKKLPQTLEGIERAFNDLTSRGFRLVKTAPTGETKTDEPQRIADSAGTATPGTKSSSGLSARTGSLAQRAAKEEITEKDMKSLSTEELRKKTREYFESQ